MKRLRLGIIGSGFAARFHVACYRRIYGLDLELAGVFSPSQRRVQFGREHGITVYDSVEAMLAHVDVVDICSPPYAHEEGILLAARAGKHVICEKPLTGDFGPANAGQEFRGDRAPKEPMLRAVMQRLSNIAHAVRKAGVLFGYAENFVYAPSIQKEREIIEKTGAQILRMIGEESHNGSASPVYGIWRYAGGGSLIGKGCHPLGGMLYLKRIEWIARDGRPIRPTRVCARVHQLTRLPHYQDRKFIRTDYHDIEDYGIMHVTFSDGTVADVLASEVVLGGVYDYVEVFANNHRTRCRISPAGILDTFNPARDQYRDVYLIEKTSTVAGWTQSAADENFTMGYQAELQDFLLGIANGNQPQSGLDLALDVTATIYSAYLSDERSGQEVEIQNV